MNSSCAGDCTWLAPCVPAAQKGDRTGTDPPQAPATIAGQTRADILLIGTGASPDPSRTTVFSFRADNPNRKNRLIPCSTPLFPLEKTTIISSGIYDGNLHEFPSTGSRGGSGRGRDQTGRAIAIETEKTGRGKKDRPYPSSNVVTPKISSSGSGTGSFVE